MTDSFHRSDQPLRSVCCLSSPAVAASSGAVATAPVGYAAPSQSPTIGIPEPYGGIECYYPQVQALSEGDKWQWYTVDGLEPVGQQVVVPAGQVIIVNRVQGEAFNFKQARPFDL